MVIDPAMLREELDLLASRKLLQEGRVRVSEQAHIVLPHHKTIDALRDKGQDAIGTTHRGIGPAYEDKAARRGIRICHLRSRDALSRALEKNIEAWAPVLQSYDEQTPDFEALRDELLAFGAFLAPYIGETSKWLDDQIQNNRRVLLEGAQGTLLDLDQGTYPFVTSSSVTAAGACTGSGLAPTRISGCLGIAKAYTTRVGSGPFPTELQDSIGETLRKNGKEFGATTGRPRRCGWLDAAALRAAIRLNGINELVITKLDVLSGIETLRIGTGYRMGQKTFSEPPTNDWENLETIYEDLPGFREDVREIRSREDLPKAARRYLDRIEILVGCPVGVVSVGAERESILGLQDPYR